LLGEYRTALVKISKTPSVGGTADYV